jgi:hypothetical protein
MRKTISLTLIQHRPQKFLFCVERERERESTDMVATGGRNGSPETLKYTYPFDKSRRISHLKMFFPNLDKSEEVYYVVCSRLREVQVC